MTGRRRQFVALALVLSTTPAAAFSHAFGERYDLPLPLGFYLAGAAAAVALSFLGSFVFMRPSVADAGALRVPIPSPVGRAIRFLVRCISLALLAMVFATGLFGPETPTDSFAILFVWVIWWVGFVLFTALLIDLWAVANPFQVCVGAILGILGRTAVARRPPWWAHWLPPAGLLFLSWTELVSERSEQPRAMALLVAIYFLALLLGAATYGVRDWFETADPLTRLFGLLGRLAPLAAEKGAFALRVPGSALVGMRLNAPGALFVITLIAIVLFDGLSETPFWAAILQWITESQMLRPWLLMLRDAGVDLMKLVRTLGMLGVLLAASLAYLGLALAIREASGRTKTYGEIFSSFAASLLPIAVAYHLAHYVFFLAIAGQLAIPIINDPFGLGWDLFGGADRVLDIGVMTAEDVWWIAAAALVAGHALSVYVAHAQALRIFPNSAVATRSQLPMMVFMVGLTSLSLWILAQPVVR